MPQDCSGHRNGTIDITDLRGALRSRNVGDRCGEDVTVPRACSDPLQEFRPTS